MRGVADNSNGGFRAAAAYRGLFYRQTTRLRDCRYAHITVISAGYGLVGADDPIYDYNYEMKGAIAEEWRHLGLHKAIAELITGERATDIVGFFAGKSDWKPYVAAQYRWFYETGARIALGNSDGNLRRAGTVFRGEGRSQTLSGLGRVLDLFLDSDLSPDALNRSLASASMPRGVKLGYLDLTLAS
jgi:hypothetical protein